MKRCALCKGRHVAVEFSFKKTFFGIFKYTEIRYACSQCAAKMISVYKDYRARRHKKGHRGVANREAING